MSLGSYSPDLFRLLRECISLQMTRIAVKFADALGELLRGHGILVVHPPERLFIQVTWMKRRSGGCTTRMPWPRRSSPKASANLTAMRVICRDMHSRRRRKRSGEYDPSDMVRPTKNRPHHVVHNPRCSC